VTASRDPRITALRRFALSITALNVLGHTVLGFEQSYLVPIVAVLSAYATELTLEILDARVNGRPVKFGRSPGSVVDFLLPAHIAGLACAMLLYANDRIGPVVLAVLVAVSSKHLFRVRVSHGGTRHFLNPSNSGICAVLLLFPWVSIAPPYHFTEWTYGPVDWVIPVAVLGAGTMLNGKLTGRMPLILGWVTGFVLQALVRAAVDPGISLAGALLPMTGVAFILYTNYMITDPGTTPSRKRNQVVFGATVAAVYGVLVAAHVVFGLFFALVLTCAMRGAVLVAARHRAGRRDVPAAPVSPVAPVSPAAPISPAVPAAAGAGTETAAGRAPATLRTE